MSEAYHHIYPQIGCDLTAVPEEFRVLASEIVEDLRPEGGRYQGCCCRYGEHRRLTDEEVERLMSGGFIVELDSDREEDYFP